MELEARPGQRRRCRLTISRLWPSADAYGGADLTRRDREAGESVDALAHGDAGSQAVLVKAVVDLAGPFDGTQRGVQPAHGLGERVAGHHHGAQPGGDAGDLHAADRDVE